MLNWLEHNRVAIVSLLVSAYFFVHMLHGYHGLVAQQQMRTKLKEYKIQLEQLESEKKQIEKKVQLLDEKSISKDYLEEISRKILNFSQPDDQIMWLD